jgi:N-acetylglucosaminyldiphosphoundecaprenol N-acetyl-beta-D-mannosaminyltransferase
MHCGPTSHEGPGSDDAAGSHTTLHREQLFGLDFVSAEDPQTVLADILSHCESADGTVPVVVTPNVDHLVLLPRAPEAARRLTTQSRWCLPDGQPIVWTSRLVGRPLATRLAGSSLVAAFWNDPALGDIPIAVIASSSSIATSVRSARPDSLALVAPWLPPDTQAAMQFVEQHVEDIVTRRPDLVFVALGFPKDLLVIDALLDMWPDTVSTPVFLAVGASFEMLFGQRKRAPAWMQSAGLEWFFRFIQEPRRLFIRYFVRDPRFVVLAARELRRASPNRRSAKGPR